MKKILFAATFALFASTQAFAIIGVGAHYITNTGSLGASTGSIDFNNPITGDAEKIEVNQGKSEGLQGLGFKLWIDFLPLIDIEGTFNIAAVRYNTTLIFPGIGPVPLSFPVEAPYSMLFDDASPIYGVAMGDVSVTYPFDVIPIITPYAGLGFSYFFSTAVVNSDFVKDVLTEDFLNSILDPTNPGALTDGSASKGIGDAVVNKLKDSGYETGIGGHIIIGVRIKPPVIPVAAYANCKRYFGGNTNSKFDKGFTFELGGGFAL
ncbi:MAG: hypothetical protein FWF67_06265 [Fibromonadales bacterium]|nr:hypothetical protein [Fibromonadales bacterium]